MGNTDNLPENLYKRLPDTELEIMRIIWAAGGSVTSADVIDRIRPRGRWANTTVLNFLGRLVEKGFVRTRKQGKCNIYSAIVDETAYLQQEGSAMLSRLFDGSFTKMISMLYDGKIVDEDDLMELHEYINKTVALPESGEITQESPESSRWTSWYKRHFRLL